MKQILSLALLCFIGVFYSCNQNSGGGSSMGEIEGYELIEYPNQTIRALKKSGNRILEEGLLVGGKKSGSWIVYHADMRPKQIYHYVDGKLDGPYYEISERGQIDKLINYKEDKLHGQSITYRFGRFQEIYNYKMGSLDGMHKIYHGNGKVQKEVEYRNGAQHGIFRYYDEEGNVTLDYKYENGEKVSGEIIEVPTAEAEKK